jgi:hypothetical protein
MALWFDLELSLGTFKKVLFNQMLRQQRFTVDVDPKEIAPDIPQFFNVLERVPWFLNLGKPHRWDREVARIHSWDEWPGPGKAMAIGFVDGLPSCARRSKQASEIASMS